MSNLSKNLNSFLRKEGVEPDNRLLAACSGGVDSMVLLHLLLDLGYRPEIVHCNFRLRGAASKTDEAFVIDFAESKGLTAHVRGFKTRQYAKENSLSIQMAARKLRYQYFEELLAGSNPGYVILGHHADDSLETIFMNLGRGSGLLPLAGIAPVRGPYLRPFWLTPKHAIERYAVEHEIQWREDLSNLEDNYQRNHIRHHLVTPLKEAFPEFDHGFTSTLRYTNDDRLLFQSLVNRQLEEILVKTRLEERFPLNHLKLHPEEKALAFHWLKSLGKFDFSALEKALEDPVSGKIFESEQGRLLVDRNALVFRFNEKRVAEEVQIDEVTEQILAPLRMSFGKRAGQHFLPDSTNRSVSLDFELLKFPLQLRRWKAGDRFVPLGMKGSKKLSDYLIDEKVDRFAKENVWVLCSGSDICWVIGHRPDERFKITDKTKNTYFAQVINDNAD